MYEWNDKFGSVLLVLKRDHIYQKS